MKCLNNLLIALYLESSTNLYALLDGELCEVGEVDEGGLVHGEPDPHAEHGRSHDEEREVEETEDVFGAVRYFCG